MNAPVRNESRPPPRVRVRQAVLDEMDAHAREEWPNECCGLLIGRTDQIARLVRARNLRASPTRYLVDPEDHFAAIRLARAEGLELVGAYHSHPGAPPVPSATDLAEATDRHHLYVIVSPGVETLRPEVRAFRLTDAGFESVELIPFG